MEISVQADLDRIYVPQDPIFIVGSPRSGTTLLQSLLATQDGLYSLPETHFFSIICRSIKTDEGGHIQRSCLGQVFKEIRRMMGMGLPRQMAERLSIVAEAKQLDIKKLFELIVFSYLCEQWDGGDLTKIRWVEKTPAHYCALETISKLYPAGQFVCIIRNPVPTSQSRKKNIPQERGVSLETLAHGWNEMISCVEGFREQNDDRIYVLKYENLVEKLEEEMRSLGAFLDVEIEADRLAKYRTVSEKFVLPWEHWKSAGRSRDIVNTNNMRLNEMRTVDILKIQRVTGKGMARYGYDISFSLIQRIFEAVVNVLMFLHVGNFIRMGKGLIGRGFGTDGKWHLR